METKKIIVVLAIHLIINGTYGQDFNDCKVDFFPLKIKTQFDINDNGKEFILNVDNIPSYELLAGPPKTKRELQIELTEKLRDNQDYNKDDSYIRDSLITHYNNLIDHLGIALFWWDYIGEATKSELKDFKKTIKQKEIGRETIFFKQYTSYSSTNFITLAEYNLYMWFMQIEKSDVELTEEAINKKVSRNRDYHGFGSFENALKRYRQIESFPHIVLLLNNKKFKLNSKIIPSECLILTIQHIDSSKIVSGGIYGDIIEFPIGLKPIFKLNDIENSKFEFIYHPDINYTLQVIGKLDFKVDNNQRLTVCNFRSYKKGLIFDKSTSMFYDKKKLIKINEFLTNLQSKNLVFSDNSDEFKTMQIHDFKFDYKSITLVFSNTDGVIERTYDIIEYPNFDFPIYYEDCYKQTLEAFNDLKLKPDYIIDSDLKQELFNAISTSPEWMNYEINRIILTSKSQWIIVTNKYTGLMKSRYLVADVYVRSTISKKCFCQEDVMFKQKADPIKGFIYSIFTSVPQFLKPYPCNLK